MGGIFKKKTFFLNMKIGKPKMLMIVLSQFGMKFGEKKLIDLKTTSTILTYFNFKQKCYSFKMESSILS
jgi:hypothetical protein